MKNTRTAPVLASLGALLLAGLSAAPAAGWESAYGPPTSFDQGFRRVAPAHCPPFAPGFVTIGTVNQDGLDPDVYVVYTDLNGARIWELAYDVQDLDLPDEGIAIAQLPNEGGGGFVFLSNSRNGVWSPALTQIRCDGRLTWSRLYPDLGGHDLRGRDLIRTQNGQLAVAGFGAMGLGEDAFLMRTNPAGVPVWHWYYDAGGEEAFHALTRSSTRWRPIPPAGRRATSCPATPSSTGSG